MGNHPPRAGPVQVTQGGVGQFADGGGNGQVGGALPRGDQGSVGFLQTGAGAPSPLLIGGLTKLLAQVGSGRPTAGQHHQARGAPPQAVDGDRSQIGIGLVELVQQGMVQKIAPGQHR